MQRKRLIPLMILFLIPMSSYAHESDRIDELEQEVQNLEMRISELERRLQQASDDGNELAPSGDGWTSLTNWRKLTKRMRPADVREILGEPQRIDGGSFTTWYYENGGDVTFYEEKVYGWSEPY